jgi:hypothetical protein
LISVATHKLVGYRYYFAAQDIRCINSANNVVVTIGHSRHLVPRGRTLVRIGQEVAPHRRYAIRIQAVKMRKRKVVKHGASYSGRMYMPGSEAYWQPVTQLPPSY